MTKNEVINKVRVLLGLEKFDEATLEDGTPITNQSEDKFAPGQKLYVKDEEGNEVPAPEGEHVTESGITVVVDAEGTITGVREPDAEGEGSLAAADYEDKKEKMEIDEEAIEEVAEAVVEEGLSPEAVLEMIAPVVEEISMMKDEIEKMKKEFEDYLEAPAKESMKKSFAKETKSEGSKLTPADRIAALRKDFIK